MGVAALAIWTAHSIAVSVPAESVLAQAENRPLYLTITDGKETVSADQKLTYAVTLDSNAADVRAYDVTLTLPSGVEVIDASDNGVVTGNSVKWNAVAVASTVSRKLYVNVAIDPTMEPGSLLTAQVAAGTEKAADSTRVIESTDIIPTSILQVRVTDQLDFVAPGEPVRYLISVTNTSASDKTFTLTAGVPMFVLFTAATGDYVFDVNTLRWRNQLIRAGEVRSYEVMGTVQRDAPDFTNIVLRAGANGLTSSDTTVVQRQAVLNDFDVSITDGQTEIARNGEERFQIVIRNNENVLATDLNVVAALPTYMEYVDSSNGGVWNGTNVRWNSLTVSPHGERSLMLVGHVRTDAPLGTVLRTTVETKGQVGVDMTTVTDKPQTVSQGSDTLPTNILRKIADHSEVQPGDTVVYTIILRNPTDHPFRNVRIDDRIDATNMSIIGSESGELQGRDHLVWSIPEIAAGQTWRTRYSVRISPTAAHGLTIDNVVTAAGEGLQTISLTERVTTSRIDIIRTMPATGAAFDQFFLAIAGLIGAVQTFLLKRRHA